MRYTTGQHDMSNDKLAERQRFEEWYTTHAHNYSINPIGSRDCALQWDAWEAALQAHAPEAAQAQVQAAEPVAITKDSDDLYTGWLSWTGKELPPGTKLYTHPQPAQDAKCPYVITSGGGTSHCQLAEQDTKDAARYRWLRDKSGRNGQPYIRCDDSPYVSMGYWVTAATADACIDRAMAKESGR